MSKDNHVLTLRSKTSAVIVALAMQEMSAAEAPRVDYGGRSKTFAITNRIQPNLLTLSQLEGRALVEIMSDRVVKRGESGPQISLIQKLLGITADGLYRKKTAMAIEKFQSSAKIGLTGEREFSTVTIGRLLAERAVNIEANTNLTQRIETARPLLVLFGTNKRIGAPMQGSNVLSAQIILNSLGCSAGNADGKTGRAFEAALEQYKSSRGIPFDTINVGQLGETTAKSLVKEYLNRP